MGSRPLEAILSRHWRPFFLVIVFSLVFNALMLTLPLYMLSIFSHVLTSKNADTLLLLTLVAVVALTLQGVVDVFRSRLLVRAGVSLEATFSPKIIESLIGRRPDAGSSELRELNDAGELRRFLTDTNLLTLIDLPFIPLYLMVITWLHPALGAVAVAGAILQLLILGMGELLIRRPLSEAISARRRNRDLSDEVFRNLDLVRAMGMMPELLGRIRQAGRESLVWLQKSADRAASLRSVLRAMRIGLQVALYCTGAWLFLSDELMVGALVAASVLLTRVMSPLDSVIPAWRGFVQARQALTRLGDALAKPTLEPLLEKNPQLSNQPSIEARRVTVRAPGAGRTLLSRINLSAHPGEMLGIIGACGSGKSIVGKLLSGAWDPAMGSLRLNGRNMRDWSAEERAALIGYCPQEPSLFAATIEENISRFKDGDEARGAVARVARSLGLDAMVSALPDAYATRLGADGISLPAGMRQQLSLARAFFGEPSVVILDEPAAWLDRSAQQALLETMNAARQRGAVVVVITHQVSLLRKADRIAVLNNGSVELIGTAEKVLSHLSGIRPSTPAISATGATAAVEPPASNTVSSASSVPFATGTL